VKILAQQNALRSSGGTRWFAGQLRIGKTPLKTMKARLDADQHQIRGERASQTEFPTETDAGAKLPCGHLHCGMDARAHVAMKISTVDGRMILAPNVPLAQITPVPPVSVLTRPSCGSEIRPMVTHSGPTTPRRGRKQRADDHDGTP